MIKNHILVWGAILSMSIGAQAGGPAEYRILADESLLKHLGIQSEHSTVDNKVGYATVDAFQLSRIHEFGHQIGKCGAFELVEGPEVLSTLNRSIMKVERQARAMSSIPLAIPDRTEVRKVIEGMKSADLVETVTWLSSYPSRYHNLREPNVHVEDMVKKLEGILASYPYSKSIETIDHRRTPQKTIRVTLTGKTHPEEIVVLGGHFDSIVQFAPTKAPGADDNASGSANILQAMIGFISMNVQPERTIEFYWYAGEEAGLLGSAEVASSYRDQGKNVVAAMQLDMTLFPAAGEFVMGSISDYTSPWLRSFLTEINRVYVGARMTETDCGYACSDHASWFRNGYPTVFPFEAEGKNYNRKIHSTSDVISSTSNFEHSLMFSKVAFVFAYEFGIHNWKPE